MAELATDQTPDISGQNPFQLIAYLLFKVRHSMEDVEEAGRAPRWVRIARIRQAQGDSDVIGKGVKLGINGFAEAISYMLELTIDLKELLLQTDAGKALVEVSAELIQAATSEAFQNGVRSLVGQPPGGDALGGVSDAIGKIKEYMDYIPEPDDVDGMGHELYRLLCLEQLAIPTKADGSVDETKLPAVSSEHVVMHNSGKLRLIQWALSSDITTHGLGTKSNPESDKYALSRMGSRRLWETAEASLPTSSLVKWTASGTPETMVEFFYDTREEDATRMLDLVEVHTLLEKLGYTHDPAVSVEEKQQFTAKLSKMLRQFQKVNDLPMNGMLDNASLNRLMHLDYAGKNIARAKPFDETRLDPSVDDLKQLCLPLSLVNPDADSWVDEGLELKTDPPGHGYYVAGRKFVSGNLEPAPTLPEQIGWISDSEDGAVPGFVALHSRVIRSQLDSSGYWYVGGEFSEGESASPFMFFAARHTEPWKDGRRGTPESNALFNGTQPNSGALHRLYQWVDIKSLQTRMKSLTTYELFIQSSVKIRSLWSDRNRQTKLSDQGRIALELYKTDAFSGDRGVARDKTKQAARVETMWYPANGQMVEEARKLEEIKRKRNWSDPACTTEWLAVPGDITGVMVVLEGKHQSAWDTDAYFDDVIVKYEIRKKPA